MKSAATTRRVIDALGELYPGATTELHYRTAFELLVATMPLGAVHDARVNMVTPNLFRALSRRGCTRRRRGTDVEAIIVSTGFFRQKAKAIVTTARLLVEHHGGQVPADMGRADGAAGRRPQDRERGAGPCARRPRAAGRSPRAARHQSHRHRRRATTPWRSNPSCVPACRPNHWTLASDVLILHGRRVCKPKPLCDQCPLTPDCRFYQTEVRTPGRRAAPARPKSRAASARPPARRAAESTLRNGTQ
jgi:endonuclease-3